ncbi:ranBP-type and C3HC4-type zinc finger-containing protein 1-like [Topomyia yanbarensis]|uniref:ranBP-type and C3HC4-type zinc finger-containing protein 1-like n=1 Tax=Topomyia yanbarensis TaxID=2498891 RepID=UPI00273CE057|nr:ranBP-type and C3HC4-type zinc finger-containing protein 1-like [Topomyia yanbarensis]
MEDNTKKDTHFEQYEQLLALAKQPLVQNNEPTKCYLCSKMTPAEAGIILANCLHTYCKLCMTNSLLQATTEQCPYPYGRYECDGMLLDQEIKSLLSPEEQNNLLKRVFDALELSDTIEAPTPMVAQDLDLLVTLSDASIVPNLQPFDCPICFGSFDAYEGVILRECFHSFCRQCLQSSIKFAEDVEIKCPFQENGNACENLIEHREIKSLLNEENYNTYLARCLQKAESSADNAFHCKKPDCTGWCLIEDAVTEFKCPVCQATNCLQCKVIHSGMNCEEYQDRLNGNYEIRRSERAMDNLVAAGEAMNCPKCKILIAKIAGCDYLVCSMCKTGICWVTRGPRWGPLGAGDKSGGCQCGLNGRKCHPSCNNCH